MFKSMTRAHRRAAAARAKARAFRFMIYVQRWDRKDVDPRRIGHMAGTHCRPCSCAMCRSEEGPAHSAIRMMLRG